jgi:hypothetical protein
MYQKGHLVIWFWGPHFPSPVDDVQERAQMVSGATYVARRNGEMTSMWLTEGEHPAKRRHTRS